MPLAVVALWLVATLGWWAFAFVPLPSEPPPWLTAARYACFGAMEQGLPEPYGWMLLVLSPASFLGGIVVLWGSEVWTAARRAARTPLGRALFAVAVLAVVTEGVWVVRKVQAARAIADAGAALDDVALPAAYPRRTDAAPDFSLVDQHGAVVSLARFRGRPVVIAFVFAHCRTMCPLIVETLERAAPVGTVLLVTVDPWRDTPATLPAMARAWGVPPNFRVLSSRRVADVLRTVEAYGVPIERNETTGDVTHPGLVFLVDGEGRLAYTFNNPPAAWVRDGLDRLTRTDDASG